MKTEFGIGDIVIIKGATHFTVGKVVKCQHSTNHNQWRCTVEWLDGTTSTVWESDLIDVEGVLRRNSRAERIETAAKRFTYMFTALDILGGHGFSCAKQGAFISLVEALESSE